MLVLTIKGDSGATLFDAAGNKIGEVRNVGFEKARIGFELPPEIKIVRNELLEGDEREAA